MGHAWNRRMKYHKVTMEPSGKSFLVSPGETILDAGLRQQFDLPYNCQEGDCATCMGRLLDGDVHYPNVEPCALTPAEINEGNILTCCSSPNKDCIIWLEGVSAPEDISEITIDCPLISCTPLNESITEITVSIAEHAEFHWQAGQYATLHNTSTHDSRPYTIANFGQEKCIFYLQHTVAYNQTLIEQIKQDEQITLTGPFGECIYHAEPADIPLLLIAGGTGFAQLRTIAEAAFLDQYPGPIHAFWGVRNKKDFHSIDLLKQWQTQYTNFKYILAVSETVTNWQGNTGLIHEVVLNNYPNLTDCRCYVSGPSAMITTVKQAFIEHGQDPELFYSD